LARRFGTIAAGSERNEHFAAVQWKFPSLGLLSQATDRYREAGPQKKGGER